MTKTTSSARGPKAARDRAVIIATYEGMVRAFRPKVRLSMSEIAKMDNWQLERAARDLYNAQSTDAVNRFARRMRIQGAPRRRPRSLLAARLRLKWVMLRSRLYLARAGLEAWWDRNHCYFMGVFSHDPVSPGVVPSVEEARDAE